MALLHVDFSSSVLGMCVQMDVILPQKPTGMIGVNDAVRSGKYPTLYLLHGMSDDHTIWQRRTSIERYATEKGIAVVMPCVHLSWYTDMHVGLKYWTYISEELPAICRQFFPNMSDKREDTWAAGLSMGGYGAMKLGLRASDTFSKVVSLSGGLDVVTLTEKRMISQKPYWESVFGPTEKVKGSFNDLFAAAEELKASGKPLPDVYMWCGTSDFLYDQNVRMREHLKKLGYNLTYTESPGDHQWKYWDEHIQLGLNWLTK
ncbi:MAG: esterase family protein [Clostridia bacterium]|nr:esterase family protein [Clostridia bacterium]